MRMRGLAACLFSLVLAFGFVPIVPSESAIADEEASVRAEGYDSRSEAISIDVNQQVSNYLINSVDSDYYKFILSSSGKVSLTFGSDFVDDTRGWRYKLIDAQGNQFAWWTHKENHVGEQTTMDIGLPAGTYYVVVTARDSHAAAHTDAPYRFRVNYEQRADWETERNNDRSFADSIVSGRLYYGSLHTEGDDDFYSLALGSPASVSLDFGVDFFDENTGWRLRLRSADNKVLGSWVIYHDRIGDLTTEQLYLPAGQYYVSVEPRDDFKAAWSPDTYRLRVNVLSDYGFVDVVPGDWYAVDDILGYAVGNGLLSGYGNGMFGPYDSVTRGQVATILWRIAGEPDASAALFDDVDYSQYYGEAIKWARSKGVISGYGDTNTFCPDDPVTREQLCVMLANYAEKIAHVSTATNCVALDRIAGASQVSSWAREQMGWAVDEGIISGEVTDSGTWVNPQGGAQRCAVAKMVSVFHRDVLSLG